MTNYSPHSIAQLANVKTYINLSRRAQVDFIFMIK